MSKISETLQVGLVIAQDWIKGHVTSLGSMAGWYLIGGGAAVLLLGSVGVDSFLATVIAWVITKAEIFGILAILLGGWLVYDKEK